ncbi:hypothetical protein DMB37_01015 [Nocardia sp. CS682]|nr:hypothetical protein DMB37_01015 [Nocardia sp. CS682]
MRKLFALICFGLLATLPLAPATHADAVEIKPLCAKSGVFKAGGNKDLCDMYYNHTLIPRCRELKSRPCYEQAAQWLADCYVGKAQVPLDLIALEIRRND